MSPDRDTDSDYLTAQTLNVDGGLAMGN